MHSTEEHFREPSNKFSYKAIAFGLTRIYTCTVLNTHSVACDMNGHMQLKMRCSILEKQHILQGYCMWSQNQNCYFQLSTHIDSFHFIITLVRRYNQGWPENKMATPLNVLRVNRLFLNLKVQFKLYEGLPVVFERWQRQLGY